MTIISFGYCKNIKWYAIFSRLIVLFEKINGSIGASHCYVDVYKEVGSSKLFDVYRVESIWPKGRVVVNQDHSKKYKDVASYKFLINHNSDEVIKWCENRIAGVPYSFGQNVFLALCNLIIQTLRLKNWTWLESIEFNGRARQNCTEAQMLIMAKYLNFYPTEGYDNFSVSEAHDTIKCIWELKGFK